MVFFEPKSWWKDYIYWLLKSSYFELFGDGKYGLFLSQEVDGKMIFTGYWEVLVLNFLVMGNTVFSSAKKLMKRWYLLGLFELSMISQDLGNTVFHAVLSALLCRITLKHDGSFYCWRCHRSFWTKSKLKCHVKVCKKKDFCGIVMPFEKENILEFNQVFQFFSFPLLIIFLWKSL